MTRQAYSYTPGSAVAVCGSRVAALVDLPADAGLVPGLYEVACDAAAGLDEVLELLVSPGLRAVENFALAEFTDEGLRTLVRGRFRTLAGSQTIEGRGLWTDRIVQADAFALLDPDAAGEATLPLAGGVVLAGRLQRRSDGSAPPRIAAPVSSPPRPDQEPGPAAGEPVAAAGSDAGPIAADDAEATPQSPAPSPAAAASPSAGDGGTGHTLPTPVTSPIASLPTPPPAPLPGPVPIDQPTFIESLPWTSTESSPEQPGANAASTADAPTAAVPTGAGAPATPGPAGPAGEASERTISRDQLPGEAVQTVVAARCPDGHLSPAYAGTCRVCGKPLPPQQPVEIPRPPLGVLKLSNGDTVVLDRGCILGRNPRVPAGTTGEQPNLVRLIDPDKDISGQHLEVRLEYWHVAVKDLGSTNGTQVVLPGENPVTLRPNDPMMIEPGTRVILAGVFSFTFEVTP